MDYKSAPVVYSASLMVQHASYKFKIMKRFYWSGINNDERIKAIDQITGLVDDYGIIVNSSRVSDLSFNMAIQIEERKVKDLFDCLKTVMSIDGVNNNLTASKKDCLVLINITFTKGTGDLTIEVPNVPG